MISETPASPVWKSTFGIFDLKTLIYLMLSVPFRTKYLVCVLFSVEWLCHIVVMFFAVEKNTIDGVKVILFLAWVKNMAVKILVIHVKAVDGCSVYFCVGSYGPMALYNVSLHSNMRSKSSSVLCRDNVGSHL